MADVSPEYPAGYRGNSSTGAVNVSSTGFRCAQFTKSRARKGSQMQGGKPIPSRPCDTDQGTIK